MTVKEALKEGLEFESTFKIKLTGDGIGCKVETMLNLKNQEIREIEMILIKSVFNTIGEQLNIDNEFTEEVSKQFLKVEASYPVEED